MAKKFLNQLESRNFLIRNFDHFFFFATKFPVMSENLYIEKYFSMLW